METCCEECIGHQRALSPSTDDDDDDDDAAYFIFKTENFQRKR